MSARTDKTKQILSFLSESKLGIEQKGDLNGLSYVFTPSLSVVKQRQTNRNNFLASSYTAGTTASVTFRSGDAFYNGKNCWLAFQAHNTSTPTEAKNIATLGSMGAFSLIESCTLISASGEVISRFQEVSRLAPLLLKLQKDPNWMQTYGSLMGFPMIANTATYYDSVTRAPGAITPVDNGAAQTAGAVCISRAAAADAPYFMLPLAALCPIFNQENTLLCPHLISGSRLEIKFRSAAEGTCYSGDVTAASIDYTIYNAHLLTDELFLSDAMLAVLNQKISKDPLELQFSEYDVMSFPVSTSSATLSYSRAFSNVSKLILIEANDINATASAETKVDTFVSALTLTQVQARIGSTLLPSEKITSLKQMYQQTIAAANSEESALGMAHGISYRYKDFTDYHPCIIWDLERSSAPLALSGAAFSNGRACQIELTRAASAKTFYIFTELTSMARISSDRVKVIH